MPAHRLVTRWPQGERHIRIVCDQRVHPIGSSSQLGEDSLSVGRSELKCINRRLQTHLGLCRVQQCKQRLDGRLPQASNLAPHAQEIRECAICKLAVACSDSLPMLSSILAIAFERCSNLM